MGGGGGWLARGVVVEFLTGAASEAVFAADLLDQAAAVTQQTGLLHNDAMIVAIMRLHGLTNLASADVDFDRVPGLTRYAAA